MLGFAAAPSLIWEDKAEQMQGVSGGCLPPPPALGRTTPPPQEGMKNY